MAVIAHRVEGNWWSTLPLIKFKSALACPCASGPFASRLLGPKKIYHDVLQTRAKASALCSRDSRTRCPSVSKGPEAFCVTAESNCSLQL